jgi:hypothetical protein
MEGKATFHDVLEAADHLPLDDQETLVEIINKRVIEQRRAELIKNVKKARKEFDQKKCKPATSGVLMKEILA